MKQKTIFDFKLILCEIYEQIVVDFYILSLSSFYYSSYICNMDFNTVKALHIIFVVSWFAGLFYIVRLFIYHTEAQEKEEVAKKILSDQYQIMEKNYGGLLLLLLWF